MAPSSFRQSQRLARGNLKRDILDNRAQLRAQTRTPRIALQDRIDIDQHHAQILDGYLVAYRGLGTGAQSGRKDGIVRTMDQAIGKVRFAVHIAGILADAEKQGYSYPLHVTVELADGRRLINVYSGGGITRSMGTLAPIPDDSLLLPATVVVREWDAATSQPREEREIRAEIKTNDGSAG